MVRGYMDGEDQRHEREAIRDAENWGFGHVFTKWIVSAKVKLAVPSAPLQSLDIYFPRIWGTYSSAKSIPLSTRVAVCWSIFCLLASA